jgi:RNA polymerase sigma factor (sigma-70 family)
MEGVEDLAGQAFRRHYRQVYGFVRRRSASDADAEDVVAEVFADAAAGLDRFRPGATPVLAWLYTVARRRLADEARRRSRLPAVAIAEPELEYGADVARAIRRALDVLPDGQRRIVVLKLIEGWGFREIAGHVGATEAACKMRFSRALDRLRDELEQEGVEP